MHNASSLLSYISPTLKENYNHTSLSLHVLLTSLCLSVADPGGSPERQG
jgi:hypothetical protein